MRGKLYSSRKWLLFYILSCLNTKYLITLCCCDSFKVTLKKHLDFICKTALSLVDETADELGKKYIADRLPPVFSALEESSTVLGKSAR